MRQMTAPHVDAQKPQHNQQVCLLFNLHVVGGFNPSGKYQSMKVAQIIKQHYLSNQDFMCLKS